MKDNSIDILYNEDHIVTFSKVNDITPVKNQNNIDTYKKNDFTEEKDRDEKK